ncbi:hypothetical protein [Methylobacterium oryzihabitans]|uniref:Uncharacterized protein n=1 Tax=Methylobacterium oryzihabitans TaxID=2499852 RepID=A0A437NVB6_9HYPH|nr:hypothetical protein [Methylobacterium oryzihabitans]RVU13953.1 hypothetical protein EOE48_25285 [Methylobacterium oryzihabitans]
MNRSVALRTGLVLLALTMALLTAFVAAPVVVLAAVGALGLAGCLSLMSTERASAPVLVPVRVRRRR